ncbi:type IV toxin-antitoxin system AbiEi family antitoxin [Cryobacterium aureum]|uniref:type IV toxin-antitoxin system AbiEi family antitoxin n=1 Tax=Cryobacterium aureum TaxID=995037 RepID=UPI000CF41105|nr:type IV toxin-antitoxin system AbiEi family antitoxin [Cryobacterium aureum]
MTHPPVRPLTLNDLPLAELYAARLDGQVFQIADSWCVIDEIDGCDTRAMAASQLVPPRAIAEQLTAAWIYGVAPEPRRHQFCVLIGARATALWSARVQVREIVRTPDDVHTISGVRVTTPLRTAVDLARYTVSSMSLPSPSLSSPTTPELTALLARLLHFGEYPDVSAAIRLCKRGSPAHSALAVARFAAVNAALYALRQQGESGGARSAAG